MINFNTVADLISMAEEGNRSIAQIILQRETERTLQSAEKIREAMFRNWIVMEEAIYKGLNSQEKSVSGLTGGDAVKLQAHTHNRKPDNRRSAPCLRFPRLCYPHRFRCPSCCTRSLQPHTP